VGCGSYRHEVGGLCSSSSSQTVGLATYTVAVITLLVKWLMSCSLGLDSNWPIAHLASWSCSGHLRMMPQANDESESLPPLPSWNCVALFEQNLHMCLDCNFVGTERRKASQTEHRFKGNGKYLLGSLITEATRRMLYNILFRI
jgi:hypothetical protein